MNSLWERPLSGDMLVFREVDINLYRNSWKRINNTHEEGPRLDKDMINYFVTSFPIQNKSRPSEKASFRCANKTGACKEPLEWRASFCATWRFDFGARQGLKMGQIPTRKPRRNFMCGKNRRFSTLQICAVVGCLFRCFQLFYWDILMYFGAYQINWISKGYIFRRTKKQNKHERVILQGN